MYWRKWEGFRWEKKLFKFRLDTVNHWCKQDEKETKRTTQRHFRNAQKKENNFVKPDEIELPVSIYTDLLEFSKRQQQFTSGVIYLDKCIVWFSAVFEIQYLWHKFIVE